MTNFAKRDKILKLVANGPVHYSAVATSVKIRAWNAKRSFARLAARGLVRVSKSGYATISSTGRKHLTVKGK